MRYASVVAGMIRHAVIVNEPATHDRVLIETFPPKQASEVVRCLLGTSARTTVGMRDESGVTSDVQTPCLRMTVGSRRYEILPFVVLPTTLQNDAAWSGSRGYASRLRDNFSVGADEGTVRILILFDQTPLETQRTTSSVELAKAMTSLNAFVVWFGGEEGSRAYTTAIHDLCVDVVTWWASDVEDNWTWSTLLPSELLERGSIFVDACRSLEDTGDVGGQLHHLGFLFRDPEIGQVASMETRLKDNRLIAAKLDRIRRQQLLDPLAETDEEVSLGPPDDQFHQALAAALRDPDQLITAAEVTYEQIRRRLRVGQPQRPAFINVEKIGVSILSPRGVPVSSDVAWRFLEEPPDDEVKSLEGIVVPSTTGRARLTLLSKEKSEVTFTVTMTRWRRRPQGKVSQLISVLTCSHQACRRSSSEREWIGEVESHRRFRSRWSSVIDL